MACAFLTRCYGAGPHGLSNERTTVCAYVPDTAPANTLAQVRWICRWRFVIALHMYQVLISGGLKYALQLYSTLSDGRRNNNTVAEVMRNLTALTFQAFHCPFGRV